MLEEAQKIKTNDPYILDSIGWAYFMTGNFIKAEVFMKRAVEIMPDDPTVNDHYGDILWSLNQKIQARYFWKSVLNLKNLEKKTKNNINYKLINGLKKS
jgi:Flp pilus assembly protein TadD